MFVLFVCEIGVSGGLLDGGREATRRALQIPELYTLIGSGDGSLCGYDGDMPVPEAGDIVYTFYQ